MKQDPKFIRTKEVARILDVDKRTITRWTVEGRIPHYKFGKNLRFIRDEILAWRDERRSG